VFRSRLQNKISKRHIGKGFFNSETVALTFPSDPRRDVVRMDHPMSAEMAVMRRSMLPGLLRSPVALVDAAVAALEAAGVRLPSSAFRQRVMLED
jgi:hypothetical protein